MSPGVAAAGITRLRLDVTWSFGSSVNELILSRVKNGSLTSYVRWYGRNWSSSETTSWVIGIEVRIKFGILLKFRHFKIKNLSYLVEKFQYLGRQESGLVFTECWVKWVADNLSSALP